MIKNLSEIQKSEIANFGGKAANLAKLIQKNFLVPPGICISTKIKKLTPKLKTEILQKINFPVAARSSATAEDSKLASFAGIFDTILNIENEKKLWRAIEKIWKSPNSACAKIYQKEKKIAKIEMAVILQKMIFPDFSGVIFTKNPVDQNSILIEISAGGGEKLVAGKIIPATFFLEKNNFSILKIFNDNNFPRKFLPKIAKIGQKIEQIFGNFQDIEFAILNEKIFLLQSRPITA